MRWPCDRRLAAAAVAIAMVPTRSARAEGPDPSAGRLEGDLTLAAGAGVTFSSTDPRANAELRVRYLDTAGLLATYEDGLLVSSASEPQRLLALGLEVRPLFLMRWLKGLEGPRSWVNLTVDSVGLEVAATYAQPRGTSFASRPGLGAGLAFELPLSAGATGPWLGFHGGMRWSDAALASGMVGSASDRTLYLAVDLAWHQLLTTHVIDLGDQGL